MNLIASSVPGRLRLRAPALRREAPARLLAARLAELPGALATAVNCRAGSIVLTYDTGLAAPAEIEATVVAAAGEICAHEGSEEPRPSAARRGVPPSLRVRVNRQAKRGMLASLFVSLVLAAAGAKRWHVVSGGLFVAFLAVHLAVHRRHLLR